MTKLDTTKTTWDLSPLLSGDDDPKIEQYRKEASNAVKAFVEKWRGRDDYLKDSKILKIALDEMEQIERLPALMREEYYFQLRTSIDSINSALKAKASKSSDFIRQLQVDLQFFWLAVGTIAKELQPTFLESPELSEYRHVLERQFETARYRLSEAEEKILLLKSKPAYADWVQMTSDAFSKEEREVTDESGKRIKAPAEKLFNLTLSKNQEVRKEAIAAVNELINDCLDMAVAEMNAILGDKKIDDELRGYERPEMSRHTGDDIDTEVVDALVEAVVSRYDIPNRYYILRARLLGMKKLLYQEKMLPYGDDDNGYTFEQAAKLIDNTLSNLDPEFGVIFRSFLENGQFDVYPRAGKRGGAFCSGPGISLPSYVMLNHDDARTRNVMTIAHEMGHAINNELIRKSQNALNYDTPLSTAEVASTFMEDFVTKRLLAEANPEQELALRVLKLDDTIATIFRQIAFYRFEQDLHASYRAEGYLPAEAIGKLFTKHMKEYLGDAFEHLEEAANWWLYIGHFRWFFYVYSYASGQLISSALQVRVAKDKNFIKEVKTFLAAGISKSPKDIFADMGIDITDKSFWEQGLNEIDQFLKDTEALAKKLGKI